MSLSRPSTEISSYYNFLFFGRTDVGKSMLAAGLSDQVELNPDGSIKSGGEITDMVWLNSDSASFGGFGQYNISVKHVVDIPWLMRKPNEGEDKPYVSNASAAILKAIEECERLVRQQGVQYIVIDNGTTLDALLMAHVDPDNDFGRKVRQAWYGIRERLNAIPCHKIYLFQMKSIYADGKDPGKVGKMSVAGLAQAGGMKASYTVDAWYDAVRTWLSYNVDVLALLDQDKDGKRYLLTSKPGHLTKNKLRTNWSDKEPANLKILFKKAGLT